MNRKTILPAWLDRFLYLELGGFYKPVCGNIVAIDWTKLEEVQRYLGTYMPITCGESFSLFSDFLVLYKNQFAMKETLRVLDFGCGTGGELVGFIFAVKAKLPNVKKIIIEAYDGNKLFVKYCQAILARCLREVDTEIVYNVYLNKIDTLKDFETFNPPDLESKDFVLSFKALNEFVAKNTFGGINPYGVFVEKFIGKINDGCVICIAEITNPIPVDGPYCSEIISAGIASYLEKKDVYQLTASRIYPQEFSIVYSGFQMAEKNTTFTDEGRKSKLTWRFLCKQEWKDVNCDIPR